MYVDPEIKKLLEEIHSLAKDNHRMLRSIRRHQIAGFFGKIAFWIVLIVVPLYVYQQYFSSITANMSALYGMGTTTPAGFSIPTTAELQKLIDSFKVKP